MTKKQQRSSKTSFKDNKNEDQFVVVQGRSNANSTQGDSSAPPDPPNSEPYPTTPIGNTNNVTNQTSMNNHFFDLGTNASSSSNSNDGLDSDGSGSNSAVQRVEETLNTLINKLTPQKDLSDANERLADKMDQLLNVFQQIVMNGNGTNHGTPVPPTIPNNTNSTHPPVENVTSIPSNNSNHGMISPNSRQSFNNNQGTPSFLQNSTSSTTIRGQNEFSTTVTNATKIRYSDMESSLKHSKLLSDSQHHLKILYTDITKSVAFAVGKEVSLFPNFDRLNRNIDFHTLLLSNVSGTDYDTSRTVYDRLGTIIHARLTSGQCIKADTSPFAYETILTHSILDGWTLLQQLFLDRAVVCGAVPDIDIDNLRVNLQLFNNENYRDFYIRTMQLVNEYKLTRQATDIPTTKILSVFIRELSRATIWVPYISSYQSQLIHHIDQHGDVKTNINPPFNNTRIVHT